MLDFERHARTPTLDIAYADSGPAGGPIVMLLHGWPDAGRAWNAVATRLNDAGYRTIVPELRGSGGTRFLRDDTIRDGSGIALAQDAVDLADTLGIARFDVVGHDWGARAAYTIAALFPQRVRRMAALALAFQPRGKFELPDFSQARRFWYQWFMSLDGGPDALAADPKGFARIQWDTWSPPGWFDETEFAATARAFDNPDWVPITLNAYRRRWRSDQPSDPALGSSYARLATIERIGVPALMIQGGVDFCDEPAGSEGQDGYFTAGYRRVVIDGVGHFPLREAPDAVAAAVIAHLK
ncbi:alpha/beta hydrolase fold protein [Caballeronia catudaia]|uniref:Alpha/beta hydrolase fold protein n=1 Tax=Caballeronia catudaia TaxID=1777136 RepID=A0A158BAD0_9BURK|nr:alpha/beta hydrolase [Caballeronia catudaia]SAK66746.1 alpha/beta hydrolase fold protein [Caballeronia catudaia]